MKKTVLTQELKILPEQLQKRLLGLIIKDMVEIVCVNKKAALHLTIVTVVLTKSVTAGKKQLLQNDVFITQLYKEHNVIVCYGAHAVFPYQSDFHATYIALNMHPKFMEYSRTENSWQALFQNHYSFLVNKQLATLERYLEEVLQQQHRSLNIFVEPLVKTGLYPAVGLVCVQLLRNYLNLLKPLLFANGTTVVRSDWELLTFLMQHYPELYQIFVCSPVDKLYLETVLDSSSGLLFSKEADCARLKKVLNGIDERFAPKVINCIGKEVEHLIKPFEGHRVFTRESYAEMVRQQVAQSLANGFGVSLIYHIETRNSNENVELVLLLVVSAVTPYLEQRMVTEVANKFGDTVKLTVLLHRMRWISKHGYAYLPFIYWNITHEQLLFEKKENTHAKFIFPVFEIPEGSFDKSQYGQYWNNCVDDLQIRWQQISDVANSAPSSAHVAVLCRIFITLCYACVYRTACYLPHLQNPQYAWKLLQWVQPDFVRLHITDQQSAEIFTLFSDSRSQPSTENNNVQTIDGSRFSLVLQICSSLYEHAERLYNE